MDFTGFAAVLGRYQYRVARYPLQVIHQRVIERLDTESRARVVYERTLGVLDAAVGYVVRDPDLAERGAALAEGTDARTPADRLAARAAQIRQQADDALSAEGGQAIERQNPPRASRDTELARVRWAVVERASITSTGRGKNTIGAPTTRRQQGSAN